MLEPTLKRFIQSTNVSFKMHTDIHLSHTFYLYRFITIALRLNVSTTENKCQLLYNTQNNLEPIY